MADQYAEFWKLLKDIDYDYEPPVYDWSALEGRFPSLSIQSYGGACPLQSEGEIFGMPYYFRFRHGHATLSLSYDDNKIYLEPTYRAGVSFGDDLLGTLSDEEFIEIFTKLASEIEEQI